MNTVCSSDEGFLPVPHTISMPGGEENAFWRLLPPGIAPSKGALYWFQAMVQIAFYLKAGVIFANPAIVVDTKDRDQVVKLFKTVYMASENVPMEYTGDFNNCVAGDTSKAYKDATILRVNYFRAMAGVVAGVELDENFTATCAQAALMMARKQQLSHVPTPNWPCYTKEGAEAAGASKLALRAAGPTAIDGYMDDNGFDNKPVGHRYGVLARFATKMGTGSVPGANALRSTGTPDFNQPYPEFLAWPPAGFIPYQVLPRVSGRWSVSALGKDLTRASVSVQRGGTNIPVSIEFADSNRITWLVHTPFADRPERDVTYSVTLTNILFNGAASSYSYDVTVVDPNPIAPFTFTAVAGLDDTTGMPATLNGPSGLALDTNGDVYIADTLNHRIQKYGRDGIVRTLAGRTGQQGSADGPGKNARLNHPRSISVNKAGELFVADSFNHTIRKISRDGLVSTVAGSAGQSGSADGLGATARFNTPSGVVVDDAGTLYVADTLNFTVRKITASGMVTTLAGSPGQLGLKSGRGDVARFSLVSGLALDSSGALLMVDQFNQQVWKLSTNAGQLEANIVTGAWLVSEGDVPTFKFPRGVAADTGGNIYYADAYNVVRQRLAAGEERSIFVLNTDDRTGLGMVAPKFVNPSGLAVDGFGDLYVLDFAQNQLFRGTPIGSPARFERIHSSSVSNQASIRTRISAPPGWTLMLDVSADLKLWMPIRTNYVPAGGLELDLPSETQTGQFFRARIVP